jgi:hypothetical protein
MRNNVSPIGSIKLMAFLHQRPTVSNVRALKITFEVFKVSFLECFLLEASAAAAPGDPFVWRRLLDARHPKSNVGLYTTELVSHHRDVYRRHDRGQMVPVLRANLIQTRCKTCYKSVISF